MGFRSAPGSPKYRQERSSCRPGPSLVLYTDGLVERRGRSIDDGFDAARQVAIREARRNPSDSSSTSSRARRERGAGRRHRDPGCPVPSGRAATARPEVPRATSRSMDLVRDAMRTWLGGAPLDASASRGRRARDLGGCANAIEHAVDPPASCSPSRAELETTRVRVVVNDTGRWAPPPGARTAGSGCRSSARSRRRSTSRTSRRERRSRSRRLPERRRPS